jgi:hypothetical protein
MEKRLQKLTRLWPPEPCPACMARPALVCVPNAETPTPNFPEGVCRECGRILYTVPVLIGVDCDEI